MVSSLGGSDEPSPLSLMNKAETSRPCGVHVFQERGFEGDEELRSVLLESPGALEPGLEIIDAAVGPSTRFDVVAIDRVRQLVLVEAAAQDADALLLRSLDHYAWALDNLALFHRTHAHHEARAAGAPRLLLAMPEISERLQALARLLPDLDLTLVEVRLLEAEGFRGIWARRVSADRAEDEKQIPHLEEDELRELMDPLRV